MVKRKSKKKRLKKIKGFSIQFLPYSEIRDLDSGGRIKKILDIVLGNNILILQGRLLPEEETRLIEDTMAMVGHVKNFRGIELAVISENGKDKERLLDKFKKNIVNVLSKGDLGAVTIIGPATVVKEIKRNPKKIELLLKK
ncbi:MAG: DUF2073 domain-containing protein [Candidatus Pacearchaeota archaeon]